MKPLAIDLFCGLGGWTEGFLAEGYDVIGFDIERRSYPAQLVLQDVNTLDGAQFRNAAVIVASPPCQAYSYRAMPWKRAKALPPPDNTLFEACFRIQREACAASGRYIPLVVENVCGAQRWVGRAAWHYGSYYLWGDVPALMPFTVGRKGIAPRGDGANAPKGTGRTSWFFDTRSDPRDGKGAAALLADGTKGNGGSWYGDYAEAKAAGRGASNRYVSSKSAARKAASAAIAKIPFDLAQHIARTYYPGTSDQPSAFSFQLALRLFADR